MRLALRKLFACPACQPLRRRDGPTAVGKAVEIIWAFLNRLSKMPHHRGKTRRTCGAEWWRSGRNCVGRITFAKGAIGLRFLVGWWGMGLLGGGFAEAVVVGYVFCGVIGSELLESID